MLIVYRRSSNSAVSGRDAGIFILHSDFSGGLFYFYHAFHITTGIFGEKRFFEFYIIDIAFYLIFNGPAPAVGRTHYEFSEEFGPGYGLCCGLFDPAPRFS